MLLKFCLLKKAKRGRPPKSHYANLGREGSGVKPPVTVSKRKQMGDYGRGDFVYFDDEEEDEVIFNYLFLISY